MFTRIYNALKSQQGQIQDGRHYPMAKMKILSFSPRIKCNTSFPHNFVRQIQF